MQTPPWLLRENCAAEIHDCSYACRIVSPFLILEYSILFKNVTDGAVAVQKLYGVGHEVSILYTVIVMTTFVYKKT